MPTVSICRSRLRIQDTCCSSQNENEADHETNTFIKKIFDVGGRNIVDADIKVCLLVHCIGEPWGKLNKTDVLRSVASMKTNLSPIALRV